MRWRPIVLLALSASACLMVGAWLLESASAVSTAAALAVLSLGTLFAATAVAGAWRAPEPAPPCADSVSLPVRDPMPAPHSPRAIR